MANDTLAFQQTGDVAHAEVRDPVEIEFVKRRAEIIALREDRAPAQARLKALETQFLEQAPIVFEREAPLGIVKGQMIWRRKAAAEAWFAIGAGKRLVRDVRPWKIGEGAGA
jgi:hypothetical protein